MLALTFCVISRCPFRQLETQEFRVLGVGRQAIKVYCYFDEF